MSANLEKFRLVFLNILVLSVWNTSFSQNCSQGVDFNFTPSPNSVNWHQFPEFTLPFTVIYSGSQQVYDPNTLIKRGFTHFSNPNSIDFLNKANRAYIYYNVAGSNQPWSTHKSPYGNDMNIYQKKWGDDLNYIKSLAGGNLDFDIFCLDIEHQHKSRDSIVALKQMNFVPSNLKTLSDDAFVTQYQKDMQNLYAQASEYIKKQINTRIFTSYGDVPVFNTFTNIQGPSWTRWQTDPGLLNYITYDFDNKKAGGGFYNSIDVLSPNAYFYYDYPHLFAGEYLSYLMFQIEANKAWSSKDQYIFLWNRYSFTPQFVGKNIKQWMAESMAIFPFLSGAKGIWLWDDINSQINNEGYAYFMKGLYRLSKFKHFFEGNYTLVHTLSARDYNENKLPIWRGVYKDGKLLVAAHNPWATSETQETKLTINYGALRQEIILKGYEVFLCEFSTDFVTANEIVDTQLTVYPNPASDEIHCKIKFDTPQNFELLVTSELGVVLKSINFLKGDRSEFNIKLNIKDLKNFPKILVTIKTNEFTNTKQVILLP